MSAAKAKVKTKRASAKPSSKPKTSKRLIAKFKKIRTEMHNRRPQKSSMDTSLADKAKTLLSGVHGDGGEAAAFRAHQEHIEQAVADTLESKEFRGRYIVEAPMGTRPLSATAPDIQLDRHASAGPYACSSCGTQIPQNGPYARVAYLSTRRVEMRERACPACKEAMLVVTAATGKMPLPSDLMKALKLQAVQTDHPRWDTLIGELNGRYVGNAVDVRVFDYVVSDELKPLLLGNGVQAEHLAEDDFDDTDEED